MSTNQNVNFPTEAFATQLPDVYIHPFPRYNLSELVPIDTTIGEDAASVEKLTGKLVGKAERNNGTNVVGGLVGYEAGKGTTPVWTFDANIQITRQDAIVAANSQYRPLRLKQLAAMETFRETSFRIAMMGEAGYTGLLNATGIKTVANLGGALTKASTADDLMDRGQKILTAIFDNSKSNRAANIVALPVPLMSKMAGTFFTGSNPDRSVLEALQALGQTLLTESGSGGTFRIRPNILLDTDAIGYSFSEEVMVMYMAQGLRFWPNQNQGSGFLVPADFRISPLELRDTTGIVKAEDIWA